MVRLTLTCLGAAGGVTGSKHLLEHGGRRILLDCGLFQGLKSERLKNWQPFPLDPETIDSVVLTHAHLDHCGYLPRLVREGFRGPIFCTSATADLAEIILLDSAKIQEHDADFANRHGFSRHKPALPLYGRHDVERALKTLEIVDFDTPTDLGHEANVTFRRAGHILGAASAELRWAGKTIAFSGDLGRYDDPLMVDPVDIPQTDILLVESTYGDRDHPRVDPAEALLEVVERTTRRGGVLIIPAFAVGRAQEVLYQLWRLKSTGRLPLTPIYLDSPMAIDATDLMHRHEADHRLAPHIARQAFGVATYVRDVEESKALTANAMPKVIIAASGMATGGRVLHHLKAYGTDARNTVLFSGYQAAGTRGADLLAGARDIKIHGQWIRIRAEVADLPMLSAHADADEIMRWLAGFRRPPERTFVVHGEPHAAQALSERIAGELGWRSEVAVEGQQVRLA